MTRKTWVIEVQSGVITGQIFGKMTFFSRAIYWDAKLLPGQKWWPKLCRQIKRCNYFLLFMTPSSLRSVYCKAEFNYALALNKPIIPIIPEEYYVEGDHDEEDDKRITIPPEWKGDIDETNFHTLETRAQLLYYVEASICDIRRDIEMNDKYQIIWEGRDNGNFSRAIALCDDIVRSDPNSNIGRQAAKIMNEIERDEAYKDIEDAILNGNIAYVQPLWEDFRVEFPGYDPRSLRRYFMTPTLDEAAINSLTNDIELFDDEADD